jgi:hypothetical protein
MEEGLRSVVCWLRNVFCKCSGVARTLTCAGVWYLGMAAEKWSSQVCLHDIWMYLESWNCTGSQRCFTSEEVVRRCLKYVEVLRLNASISACEKTSEWQQVSIADVCIKRC